MDADQTLREAAAKRILVLDGAMGTMIQEFKLDEAGYRGARFDAWNREVRGNNDLLNLSQPKAVRDIHLAYFRAGADIVSTNTFSSTSIACVRTASMFRSRRASCRCRTSSRREPSRCAPAPRCRIGWRRASTGSTTIRRHAS